MLEGKVFKSEFLLSKISPVDVSMIKAVSAILSIANKDFENKKKFKAKKSKRKIYMKKDKVEIEVKQN